MAFTVIPTSWIEVGKSLKKELFDAIKNSLDDHETRIDNVEQGLSKIELFNFEVIGYISHYSNLELIGIGTYRAVNNISITDAKITILNSGSSPLTTSSSGVLSIDLEKSSNNGLTWTSILETYPNIPDGTYVTGSTSGAFSFITNGELISADELVRVSIKTRKDSQGSFLISVYSELQ